MAEILDIYDSEMNKTGSMERGEVHRLGLWHVVAHIWLIDLKDGDAKVLFQKRSMEKQQQPGLFDIAVGGHISAGETVLDGAVREMYEELGVKADKDKLIYLGRVREDFGEEDSDKEFGEVFGYMLDTVPKIGDEVDMYVKIDADSYFKFLTENESAVDAVCDDGKVIKIRRDMWCSHPNEFENIVYPWIRSLKK